ncbi:MAG: hypothetical protein A3F72_01840 [Bacteroidetes bacterium RIFCSPLOWO2_12_FULL_35_15]|nr:MAG: hypothetical protein A3F72_01840 [Bacteroidetes bacterium RIFCSPLOWO2_12_FULL_35_15]
MFAQLENIPLVTVFGEAAVKVKPDYVIIGIKVKKEIRLNSATNKTVFEIFNTEDTKVRLFGFDDKNVSESLIQVDSSVYVKEIFITINDLTNLDKYLLELYKLGFKNYIYLDYRVKNYDDYKNQARKEAISSAKAKATSLATELGQSIGKAHTIEEINSENYNWYNIHNNANLENITFKLGADGYVIDPGFLIITSKIKVSFDLLK